MQKFVNFIEQHVQWLALGIGAIYLLWMVWAFLLQSPVHVNVAGQELGPGDVDRQTLEGPVQKINEDINSPFVPDIASPDITGRFVAAISGAEPVSPLASNWSSAQPAGEIKKQRIGDPPTTQDIQNTALVNELPQPPTAEIMGVKYGRSTLAIPDPNQPKGAQGQRAKGVPVGNPKDMDWATIFYKIPTAELAKQFQEKKIPPDVFNTVVLEVELIREEQLPNLSWGKPTVIRALPIHDMQPFPAEGNKQAEAGFAEWASNNTEAIVVPEFYGVLKGDKWLLLGQEDKGKLIKERPFDPARPPKDRELTAEEKRKVAKYKRELQRQQKSGKQPRRRGRDDTPVFPGPGDFMPGGPGGGLRPGALAPQDEARPRTIQNERPVGPLMPGMMPGEFGDFPFPGGPFDPAAVPDAEGRRGKANIPRGAFDPSKTNDIEGWAHDDTIEPDKTYRYRIRYKLRNPTYQTANLTDPAKLADQLALQSEPSAPTELVVVPPMVNFFVANSPVQGGNTVRFDVFRWQDGNWQMHPVTVAPGDLLSVRAEESDFSVGWIVVAFRLDEKQDTEILLVNEAGEMTTRAFKTDQVDPEYKKLKQQASATKPGPVARTNNDR